MKSSLGSGQPAGRVLRGPLRRGACPLPQRPLYPVFHHRGHPPHPRQHPVLLHERRRLQRPARRRAFWGADLSGGAGHCGRHGHRMVSGRFKPEAPGAAVKRVLRRAPAA